MKELMKQHILPEMYLKGFVDTDHSTPSHVWIYKASKRSWEIKGKRVVAQECDYYTFKDAEGNRNDTFEDFLAGIGNKTAPILRNKIFQYKPLDAEEKKLFSEFVASMYFKVPEMHDYVGDFISPLLQEIAKAFSRDPEVIELLENKYRHEAGSSNAELLQSEDIDPQWFSEIQASKPYTIFVALQMIRTFSEAISLMDWTFLTSPSASSFITSDAPCFMIDPVNARPGGSLGGWASKDIEITLPLAHDVALLAKWNNDDTGWRPASKKTIREINLRTAAHASRFLIASKPKVEGGEGWFDEWPLPRIAT